MGGRNGKPSVVDGRRSDKKDNATGGAVPRLLAMPLHATVYSGTLSTHLSFVDRRTHYTVCE